MTEYKVGMKVRIISNITTLGNSNGIVLLNNQVGEIIEVMNYAHGNVKPRVRVAFNGFSYWLELNEIVPA